MKMYVLIAYDVKDGRTEIFRKLLSRFLIHEQFSVFAGNISESTLLKLRGELSKHAGPEDSFIEICAHNRNNVSVNKLTKSTGNGMMKEEDNNHHKHDFLVL